MQLLLLRSSSSLICYNGLHVFLFLEHEFTNELDWVLRLIIGQFLQCLDQRSHNMFVEVLANWKIFIPCLFFLLELLVFSFSSV